MAAPDRNDEYTFYQLLVGTWPVELVDGAGLDPEALASYAERLKGALTKSMREAKLHSTWAAPDPAYEAAMLGFVDLAFGLGRSGSFLDAFLPFVEGIARLGAHNTLVQTVLKLTVPGMPDIYQGTELWDLSLVDPDDRRPVQYSLRMRLLEETEAALDADRGEAMPRFFRNWRDGRFKLAALATLLGLHREQPVLFAEGVYEPVAAQGPQADQLCTFLRSQGDATVLVATARFPSRFQAESFGHDTALALPETLQGTSWRDVLTGREIRAKDGALAASAVFAALPAAVLLPAAS